MKTKTRVVEEQHEIDFNVGSLNTVDQYLAALQDLSDKGYGYAKVSFQFYNVNYDTITLKWKTQREL